MQLGIVTSVNHRLASRKYKISLLIRCSCRLNIFYPLFANVIQVSLSKNLWEEKDILVGKLDTRFFNMSKFHHLACALLFFSLKKHNKILGNIFLQDFIRSCCVEREILLDVFYISVRSSQRQIYMFR